MPAVELPLGDLELNPTAPATPTRPTSPTSPSDAANMPQELRLPSDSGVDYAIPQQEMLGSPVPMAPNANAPIPAEQPLMEDYSAGQFDWNGGLLTDSTAVTGDAFSGDTPVYSSGSWHRTGNGFAEVDLAAWTKSAPRARAVGIFDASTVLFTDSEPYGFHSGVHATLGRYFGRDIGNRDHMLEATFLGGFEWESGYAIAGNAVTNFFLGSGSRAAFFSGTNAETLDTDMKSDLNSLELNYRIRTRPTRDSMALQPNGVWVRHNTAGQIRSVLFGFRGMSLNEQFRLQAIDTGIVDRNLAGAPITADIARGDYLVRTSNDMFGVQLGGEVYEQMNEWQWGARAKAGGIFNFAKRRSSLVTISALGDDDIDDDVNRVAETLNEEHLAFITDASVFGVYNLRPNISLRVSYDVFFITGVALADENLGLNETFPGMSTTGVALYHGASFGFETQW